MVTNLGVLVGIFVTFAIGTFIIATLDTLINGTAVDAVFTSILQGMQDGASIFPIVVILAVIALAGFKLKMSN